jgi:trimeric autotransporter adhesin
MSAFRPHVLASALLLALVPALAASESLRYSGSLTDAGEPANGAYALRLALYDAARGGHRIGREVTLPQVDVARGGFAVDADFGLPLVTLQQAWLQVEVAGAEGEFEPLGRRESLDAKALAGTACWSTSGNAGTLAGTDFLGTTDLQPLVLKANTAEAARFEYTAFSPNVVLGDEANFVSDGVYGATVGGGGNATGGSDASGPNRVMSHYATISGGADNAIGLVQLGAPQNPNVGSHAAIAGGEDNRATGRWAFVAGGTGNRANADNSIAAGQFALVRGPQDGAAPVVGDSGSFVWADDQGLDFATTGPAQFLVRSSGGVALNGTPPRRSRDLTVWGNGSADNNVDIHLRPKDSTFGYGLAVTGSSQADTTFLLLHTNGDAISTERLRVAANGDFAVTGNAFKPGGGSWAVSSDARLKKHVEPLGGALERLLSLRGVSYEYRSPDALRPAGTHHGFVAQEVQKVFPRWVATDDAGYLTVAPQGFEALAVEALRELAEENALLREELEQIKRLLHTAPAARRQER